MAKKKTAIEPAIVSEELVIRFLDEVLAVVKSKEKFGDAHDALHDGYFGSLRLYLMHGDSNVMMGMPRPKPLQIFVDAHVLHGYFRAWLRKEGIDPDTVKLPINRPALEKYEFEYFAN